MEGTTVYDGGIGVKGGKKSKIETKKQTYVTAAGTFAKAEHITVDNTSAITNMYYTPANIPWPSFEAYAGGNAGANVNVPNGATMTLSQAVYREIKAGKNSTIIFTEPVVDIEKKLKLEEGATVKFNQTCTKLRMKDKLEAGRDISWNPDGHTVIAYVDDDVTFEGGAHMNGVFYLGSADSPDTVKHKLIVKDSKDRPGIFKGMFLAENIESGKNNNWYFSSTCNTCIFPRNLTVTEPEELNAAAAEALVKTYPNPFSGKTTVLFMLPQDSKVRLDIYDMSGKLIQSLYKGDVTGNTEYRLEFDGTELPGGTYIYRMLTNEGIYTGKMILIR